VDEPGALPAPAPPIADDPVSARPVSQAVADTARSSAPLLAVVLLLALFAVLHARMDRDDPKLASAPVDNDVLGFR
jgi:hypothetical protein